MSKMSAPCSLARLIASKASAAASAPSAPERLAPRRAPQTELLDRRGAERVARREHDRLAFAGPFCGELGDGRRLARAVDADDEDDEGRLAVVDDERLRRPAPARARLRGEDLAHFLGLDVRS